MKGVKKGRVVVNFRPLNRTTISDVYLLSFQQDIIDSIYRKQYITVVNIFNFFFQLFIYFDYRNRFIFISQRKVERLKIVFIGFINSFSYT